MKQISLFALCVILLSACGTPAVSQTATPEASPTFTLAPTETPTPDPMADAPEGATGKDEDGFYLEDAETGERFRYVTVKDNAGEVKFEGWVVNHAKEQIHILDKDQSIRIYKDLWPSTFMFSYGVDGPYLKNPDPLPEKVNANWTSFYYLALHQAKFNNVSLIDFFGQVVDQENIEIPIRTTESEFVWRPNSRVGLDRYVVPWEALDPATYPGTVWETMDYLEREKLIYRWTVFLGENENLVTISAVEHPENLTFDQWLRLLYGPFITATYEDEVSEEVSFFTNPSTIDNAGNSASPNIEVIK